MVLLLVALAALLALVSACVESSEEDARTPSNATTIVNTAPQTNSKGETVPAPGASVPTEEPGGGEPGAGDAAAGEAVFAATCTSCHLNNGKDAGGIGPQIAGQGLDEPTVRDIVENGIPGTAMVGGLVTGDDYENIVAYILSLQ